MKTARLKKPITSKWIVSEDWRLDAGPYLSGKIEALLALERLRTERLVDLTHGHDEGIFRRPQHNRSWVNDPAYGVPYIGSSDMMLADLTRLPLLRRSYAQSTRLACMELKEGMTLISASGTIGRTVYCRPEMAGMWSSEDVMKIVPNPKKILPGYLFSFLKSRFGRPLVLSGTYGAIIQHIEPEHLRDLPVPRLSATVEKEIHTHIDRAGKLRSEAAKIFSFGIEIIYKSFNLSRLPKRDVWSTDVNTVRSLECTRRWDAHFHGSVHLEALRSIRSAGRTSTIAKMATKVIEPLRFRRIEVASGIPFFGTSAIQEAEPEVSYHLPSKSDMNAYRVDDKTVLVPRSGQLPGLIGEPVLPIGEVLGGAVSEDAIRIICKSGEIAGFLFLFLSTEHGRRQLKAQAYGTSIPHLDVAGISSVVLPLPSEKNVSDIGSLGQQVRNLRHNAIQEELIGIHKLESSILNLTSGAS